MTIKQKQWQLYYLGYYGNSLNDIDGIWGNKSKEATRKFQKESGLQDDSIFGPNTEVKSMEIIENIQEIVSAHHTLEKDGLAGPKTMVATIYFQKAVGLTPDGIAGPLTRGYILNHAEPDSNGGSENRDWWDDIKFFTRDEFKCKCGGKYCDGFPAEPQKLLVTIAERARKHFNAPATVVSGLRCQTHNINEGGVANSQHMYGEAVDLSIRGVSADELLAYIQQQTDVRYAYKIDPNNVHFDIPRRKR